MQCAQCHHPSVRALEPERLLQPWGVLQPGGTEADGDPGRGRDLPQAWHSPAGEQEDEDPGDPAVLGGPTLAIPPDEDPRLKLADWMSDKANSFLAKSLVNRYWKHFFKRGLIEPEDDIRETNPATNPELLEALADHFVASGHDLKAVVRVITQSNTYQLSATPNAYNAVDRQNFSHYYPKRMQAEVLLDALDQLTGATTNFADLPPGTSAISLPDNSYNRSSPS